MIRFFSLCFVVWYSIVSVSGQQTNSDQVISHKGSGLYHTKSAGTLFPKNIKEDWNISLKTKSSFFHNSALPLEEYKKLKDEANALKYHGIKNEISGRSSATAPVLQSNFRGNLRGNSIPMDNSMAVSRNGFVVSAINSNVIFAGPDGTVTYRKGFSDFFKLLGLGTRMFDPRVIYDPEQNRFIVVCLHSSDPALSYVCIAFSKTEDPNGEWNFYKVKGDAVGDNLWFDFPNIAVSHDDLFITGNMFTSENSFRYSMIFQISKNDGYSGEELTWKYYDRVTTANGGFLFNTIPAMSGLEILTSPGIFFLNNSNNKYHIHQITESVKNNPSLISVTTTGPPMTFPPDGRQKDVNITLDTGDNRIGSAIFMNGVIHFAAQSNSLTGDGGIFYGRLRLSDLQVYADVLSAPGRDYAYPTLTSFGNDQNSDKVLVNYNYTGPEIYPGQAVRIVGGTNDQFDWSDEVILKEGVSAIGVDVQPSIRWGDYTGACRRFGTGRTESWTVGCFGEVKSHGTWIGQFVSEEDSQDPIMDFTASRTTTPRDSVITFKDITNNIPRARKWIFEGGIPAVSESALPEVTYPENGVYTVTLISEFENRTDTFTKKEFIHIIQDEVKPTVDWLADKDTIFIGDTILFTSLSSANTLTQKWTFINGNPSFSVEKTQVVKYTKKGSFLVSLTASNSVGSSTLTKTKAVTVLDNTIPKASFSSNKNSILPGDSILYFDASTGWNNSQIWKFEGGVPSTSSDKNPIVTYPNGGVFSVKLSVENIFGKDSILKDNYVSVTPSATIQNFPIQDIILFPNPAVSGLDQVSVRFNNLQNSRYKINLVDTNGKLVKSLYNDKIKMGESTLTFNTNSLMPGMYYIRFYHTEGQSKSLALLISE
ncbi:MAG: PKD domain-containing protein [Saprospiraceae bacterium]|nr:PKD domain-containing protein [Saprospiraceae bacterium]MBK8671241.1 PKD domain-containing protein [Saprospiraceae bacterium]